MLNDAGHYKAHIDAMVTEFERIGIGWSRPRNKNSIFTAYSILEMRPFHYIHSNSSEFYTVSCRVGVRGLRKKIKRKSFTLYFYYANRTVKIIKFYHH